MISIISLSRSQVASRDYQPSLLKDLRCTLAEGALIHWQRRSCKRREQITERALSAADYIASHTLSGLVTIKSATFSGSFNALKGGQVTLQFELEYLGQDRNVSIDFDLNKLENSAQSLAHMLLAQV